jgi:type I restriction enzyme, R subunit
LCQTPNAWIRCCSCRNPAFQDLLVNYPRPRTAFIMAHTARDEIGSEGLIRAGSGREYRPGDYLET